MNNCAILIVEDDIISGRFFSAALEPYQITLCSRADEALSAIAERSFALWLIDLNLPDADGVDLLHAMLARVSLPPPVLAMSADIPDYRAAELERQGFDGSLRKPLDVADLRSRIDALLAPGHSMFDDAQALRTAGGNADLVASLRMLWKQQLSGEMLDLGDELRSGAATAAADRLHRMQAAAAFCGAPGIQAICQRIEQRLRLSPPDIPAVQIKRLDALVAELLSNPDLPSGKV